MGISAAICTYTYMEITLTWKIEIIVVGYPPIKTTNVIEPWFSIIMKRSKNTSARKYYLRMLYC